MTSEAAYCRDAFTAAISAEIGDKSRAQLIYSIARATDMSERRVVEIIRGTVQRVWADEFAKVKEWRATWIDRQEARLNHQIELLRQSGAARRSAA
jgi:23S rRNA C2498 (ribose-2'-O)-methylase RlmM